MRCRDYGFRPSSANETQQQALVLAKCSWRREDVLLHERRLCLLNVGFLAYPVCNPTLSIFGNRPRRNFGRVRGRRWNGLKKRDREGLSLCCRRWLGYPPTRRKQDYRCHSRKRPFPNRLPPTRGSCL